MERARRALEAWRQLSGAMTAEAATVDLRDDGHRAPAQMSRTNTSELALAQQIIT